MTYLVLCPFVHRESFDQMWATMHPKLRERALVLDNTVANLGAAGSRNVGIETMVSEEVDWLVDVSPATRFGPSGGLEFVEALESMDGRWVVQSSAPVNWHLIAWSRTLYERVGLWDENAWPIYGEDYDMARRIAIAAREDTYEHDGDRPWIWECIDADAWVTMYGHSMKLAGVNVNMRKIWGYMERKWGGPQGSEAWERPFRDYPLGWWPPRGHPWALEHKGQP